MRSGRQLPSGGRRRASWPLPDCYGELLVAVFGVDVFCNRDRRLLGVEDKRSLSLGGESRVVTEQCPVTGIHGHLLVFELAVEIETVVDAGAVADDQGRTIVCFRFLENLQGLSVVCAEGDTAHVNVLVAHGDEAQVLLAGALTSERRGRLRHG